MITTLFAFVLAIGVIVTLHELGHYLAARACGVHVEKFSFGFGPTLFSRTDRHGTQWAISAIALGGYVRMRDDSWEGADQSLQSTCFNHKALWQKAFIVFAGPLANFVLAVLFFAWVGMLGTSMPAAVLGEPSPGTPAAMAGVQHGDRLLAINDNELTSWGDARWRLLELLPKGGRVVLQVQTGQGARAERELILNPNVLNPDVSLDPLTETGLNLAQPHPVVVQVLEGAGQQAGMQAGDVILQLGEQAHPSAQQFIDTLRQSADQSLKVRVLRQNTLIDLMLTPQAQIDEQGQPVGRIGVVVRPDFEMIQVKHGFFAAIAYGAHRTYDTVKLLGKMLAYLVTGEVSSKNLSGPIAIADQAGQTAKMGLVAYLSFIAMINVSMGILNLLPIPMLDGGHLLYYAIEAVRGRPLSLQWQMATQRLGFGILAALMMFAVFNDLTRLFS